jgi:predicted nucleic acid-binding protein
MEKIRVYLDNCCFNRPYDNQTNLMVYLETEAKLFVQDLILKETLELIWSFVLDYENNDNPFEERKKNIISWKGLAVIDCDLCDEIADEANDLMKLGLKQKDASHIACAIYANADYFLTTDKKILNKPISSVQIVNPIEFVRRYLDE